MYNRYKYCCPGPTPATLRPSPSVCCPDRLAGSSKAGSNPGAIPESARVLKEQCPTAWVQTVVPTMCIDSDAANPGATVQVQKIQVPVQKGSMPPSVPVVTTPASVTSQLRSTAVLMNASNPYDPTTRFSQYFPPQPPGYECPERIPNNLPKPSTRDCVPVSRFHGSA